MYREEIKLMFCTYCEDQGENGSFVSDCNYFRVDALNAYELSEQQVRMYTITRDGSGEDDDDEPGINDDLLCGIFVSTLNHWIQKWDPVSLIWTSSILI
jgi:hypothetical protein